MNTPLTSTNLNRPLNEIRRRIDSYPAMPAMCQHLIKSCEDPDVNFKKLVDEIRYDPGITANILKMANSAYYGSSRRIESLQTAMVRLGLKQISEIVIAHSVADRLVKKLQGYDLRPEELLKHSVWVAIAAEDLANVLHIKPPAMLFTAGLLHDLGKIILDDYILDQREALLKATGKNGEDKISFDIVFADINMPVMNGEEMVEIMAQQKMLDETPVVIISTDRSVTRIEKLLSKGVRAYLNKPFTPESVRDVIIDILGQS